MPLDAVAGDMKASLDALGADPGPPLDGSTVLTWCALSKWRSLSRKLVLEAIVLTQRFGHGSGSFFL
jgi:hypothetical protein